MQTYCNMIKFLLLLVVLLPFYATAQDEETPTDIVDTTKRLHAGVYIGVYYPNKYSTNLYDGYGFNPDGIKNDFANSFMNQQINFFYGGGNGGTDQIANILNVNHADWSFGETDMPYNLGYNMAYIVGFNGSYNLNKKSAIIFNINGTKLTMNGKFTINTVNKTNGSVTPSTIHQCTILGGEQRVMFQFGYQKVLTNHDKFNFFIEGGLNIVMAKLLQNKIIISNNNTPNGNSLEIDLTSFYNQSNYTYYKSKLTSVGYGIFAGAGLHLTINPKYTIQALYNPSYDRVNLGQAPTFKFNHGFGLRFYYNF